jgi:excisionase family DNA binding protein
MVISSEGMEPDMYLSTDERTRAQAGRSATDARLVGMSETLRTAEEVAERLRVPKTWVYRAAREGHLPSVRCGRYRRFDDRDVDRWIDGQRGQAVESVG